MKLVSTAVLVAGLFGKLSCDLSPEEQVELDA